VQLQQILQRKLIPRAKAGAAERIIVARKRMSLATVPSGVELTHRKLEGKRVRTKVGRLASNIRRISAKWPEAGMHESENARLACVVEGEAHFQVGNYLLGCREGDFILIPPHLPYPGDKYLPHLLGSRVPGRPCQLLWMLQYPHGFHCYLSRYESAQRKIEPMENRLYLSRQVIELFHLLVEEAAGEKNNQLCDGLLLAFFTALQREGEAKRYLHPGAIVESGTPPTQDNFTGQLEEYVKQHLNQSMTSEQVARELYMSRSQFVRRIRQETGKTFVEFLSTYRIQQAKTLLKESEWPVHTIAKYVGFKSSTYFHAFFQRQIGCSPGEFRLKTRNITHLIKNEAIK